MFGERLADLDELILRCRNEQAKTFIAEAVACYRAGAFRSCIVATWIAVVFDLIEKFRELDLIGDSNAHHQMERLEHLRQNNDLQGSLAFERGVLDIAKDEFMLLSPLEYEDLRRLFEDRNRCAHPSLVSLEEPYRPTGELARYHLRNAVVSLLQQPPVQGKVARDRIWADIQSSYFPTNVDQAADHFQHGPLERARPSLARGIMVELTKNLLLGQPSLTERARYTTALKAALQLYPQLGEQVLCQDVPAIVARVPDSAFAQVIAFMRAIPTAWEDLDEPRRIKASLFVQSCPPETAAPVITDALHIPALHAIACQRIHDLSQEALAEQLPQEMLPEYIDEAIRRLERAENFKQANEMVETLILPALPALSVEQIIRLLDAFVRNNQLKGSYGAQEMLEQLLPHSLQYAEITKDAWIRVYECAYVFIPDQLVKKEDWPVLKQIEAVYPDVLALATARAKDHYARVLQEEQEADGERR